MLEFISLTIIQATQLNNSAVIAGKSLWVMAPVKTANIYKTIIIIVSPINFLYSCTNKLLLLFLPPSLSLCLCPQYACYSMRNAWNPVIIIHGLIKVLQLSF